MRSFVSRGLSLLVVSGAFALTNACSSSVGDAPAPAPSQSPSSDVPPTPPAPDGGSTLPTAASLGLDLSDAFGGPNVALPPGAKLVDVTQAPGLIANNKPARWLGPKQQANDAQLAADERVQDEATIAAFTSTHSLAADVTSLFSSVPDPNDSNVKQLPNGDYLVSIPGTAAVETLGLATKRHTIARAMREYPARSNQEGIYAALYAHFPNAAGAPLPAPGNLGGVSDADLASKIHNMLSWFSDSGWRPTVDRPPSGYSEDCSNDDGSDAQTGDRINVTYGTHDPAGLFANISWKNKWNVTCVKNQANRGSCVSFGTVSALEMLAKKKTGRWVNLSEQHVIGTYKTRWSPNEYNEGGDVGDLTKKMNEAGYVVPFETDWHYNPSGKRRQPAGDGTPYTHSCDDYSEYCSDTAHQALETCFRVLGATFCATRTQDGGPTSSASAPAQDHLSLTDYDDRDHMLMQTIMTLYFGDRAVIAGIGATERFIRTPSTGYVDDILSKEVGGHAVHVVSYIANADLPSSIPPADGFGYFIIKNSWGTGAGDQGYFYVPYTWMKLYTYDLTAL